MVKSLELFFDEPRLKMSQAGRFFVRLVFYSVYIILIAATVTFLLSDIPAIFWSGVLTSLFLLDRFLHAKRGDRSLRRINDKKRVNIADYLTSGSYNVLEYSFERAFWTGGDFHLFLIKKLLDKKDVQEGLLRMDVKPEELEQKVEEYLDASLEKTYYSGNRADRQKQLIAEVEKLVRQAFLEEAEAGGRFLEPRDLFSALGGVNSQAILKLFQLFSIDSSDLRNALIFSRYRWDFWKLRRLPAVLGGFAPKPYAVRHKVMNRAWSARPTPTLDKYGEDLTDYARSERIGFLIGQEGAYDRMVDILSRPAKPNVLLVGDPGVGKNSLVAHLAFKIIKDDVPPELFDERLVQLNIGSLVAGADQAELQQRVRTIVEEIVKAGNIVLYIPDIHNLAKSTEKTGMTIADVLLPAIASDAFSVIGATYSREYKQWIESHTDFSMAFDVIRMEEISEAQARKILVYHALILEQQYKIKISFSAIKEAVTLAHKYFRDRLLPASAEELLKEALSDIKERGNKFLTAEDVLDIAQRKINIPLRQAESGEAAKLLNLENLIHQRLVDQEEAVQAVARAMREYRSGLARKGGPIASFLFVGPTGVGKTELSKILANIQFGSKEAMFRFDMSEYQEKQSLFRFIGSPDGGIGGALTDAVLRRPYCLVLLDEFEKAHPDILNLFLQVFDDGRLTDNLGKLVDFQNTIIIATSNAHSEFIKTEIEKGRPMREIAEDLKKKLTVYFKPELINRFSGITVFKNLSPEDTLAIAKIQLDDLAGELKENQGIELQLDEAAIKKIGEWGFDPVFGARPLRGVISEKIRSVLAEKILKREIGRGSSVNISLENNQLVFKD